MLKKDSFRGGAPNVGQQFSSWRSRWSLTGRRRWVLRQNGTSSDASKMKMR